MTLVTSSSHAVLRRLAGSSMCACSLEPNIEDSVSVPGLLNIAHYNEHLVYKAADMHEPYHKN